MDDRNPWDDYRVRRNVLLVAAAGVLPVWLWLCPLVAGLSGVGWTRFVPLVSWGGFLGWAVERWVGFRCPLCGLPFFENHAAARFAPLARRCTHCGLRKWFVPEVEFFDEAPEGEGHHTPTASDETTDA